MIRAMSMSTVGSPIMSLICFPPSIKMYLRQNTCWQLAHFVETALPSSKSRHPLTPHIRLIVSDGCICHTYVLQLDSTCRSS